MIIDYLIDVLCILFLLFNAVICFTWVGMRDKLQWKGRRGVKIAVQGLVVFVGIYHVLFVIAKTAWLVTELMTWGW